MSKKVLEGIKVLDLSWITVGPMITSALARFGAEVIRVESRSRVDHTRTSPPFKEGDEADR